MSGYLSITKSSLSNIFDYMINIAHMLSNRGYDVHMSDDMLEITISHIKILLRIVC